MTEVQLDHRDYTVIVAKTARSVAHAPPGFEARWTAAYGAIIELIHACEKFDQDGITLYVSSRDQTKGTFSQHHHVRSDQVEAIVTANFPPTTVDLLEGLQLSLEAYFHRKATGTAKHNGEIIVVLIDGEPHNRSDVVKLLVEASQRIDLDSELGIGFAQVGDDVLTRGFLKSLDEDLRSSAGAKFDIVHTRVLEQIYPACLTEFLRDIIRC